MAHKKPLLLSAYNTLHISETYLDKSSLFGNFFEKILFNSIFGYLHGNFLLCDNQSRFRPSDSCEYQLLSTVHDIYASLDCKPLIAPQRCERDIS